VVATLREFRASDHDRLVELANDEQVSRYVDIHQVARYRP